MNARDLARNVVRTLRVSGFQAYLVGGCVRDLLLGRDPVDYDVATDATPAKIRSLFRHCESVGAHFGVVLVKDAGCHVELATFRSDNSYRDGRHPESVDLVSDPRQDAMRRDFTINALLQDPETGQVLDYVGGEQDLRSRLVRAIGDPPARFQEDHLRLLRAIRFAARLGFEIEPATLEAIRQMARLIHRVSAERIRDELVRILTEGGARRGFELLDATGLLLEVLPEVAIMKGVAQPAEFHPEGDVWTHTLLMLEQMRDPSPALALGVLLHDVGKPPTFRVAERIRFDGHVEAGAQMAVKILERLRCSSQQIRQVEALVRNHLRFKDAPQMRPSTLKRFLRLENFEEHLELHRLDCLGSHRNLDNYNYVKARLAETPEELLKPAPFLSGHDLIAMGLQPGPLFKEILSAVEDAQLDGKLGSREQALNWVRSRYPQD